MPIIPLTHSSPFLFRIYAQQKPMQSLSTALLPMAEPLLVLLMLPQITFQTASSKALKMLMNSVMFSPQKSSPVFPKRPFLT